MNLKFRNENEAMDKSGGVRRARRRRRRRRKQQHTIPDDSGPAESTNDQWKPIIKTGSVITTQSTNQLEIIGGNPSRRKPQTVGAGGGGGEKTAAPTCDRLQRRKRPRYCIRDEPVRSNRIKSK